MKGKSKVRDTRAGGRGNLILIHSSSFESAAMGVVRRLPSLQKGRHGHFGMQIALWRRWPVHENEALVPFSPLSLSRGIWPGKK